ncbi:unnamed protein product, partial [Didymodactylos carnosus]
MIYAFARDGAIPGGKFFGMNETTKTPITAVWAVVVVSILLGMLRFASVAAINAVFSLCAIALDWSYMIPIFCKLLFCGVLGMVPFKGGPFHMGKLGFVVDGIACTWILFVSGILMMPTVYPVTAINMN